MIHPSAIVSPAASLGDEVKIGPFAIVHDDVTIGDGSVIEAYCEIGHPTPLAAGAPLVIGERAHVRTHSILYAGSRFGPRLVTGHHVVLREGIAAGESLQVGSFGDIQGRCTIGAFVKCQSGVFVAQGSTIGSYVWLLPGVMLTNDPHPPSDTELGVIIEDFVAIAARAVVMPGVRIGEGALVGANSLANRDVAADTVVVGSPARFLCRTDEVMLRDGSGGRAYPWRRHFHRGYPSEMVAAWLAEIDKTGGAPQD